MTSQIYLSFENRPYSLINIDILALFLQWEILFPVIAYFSGTAAYLSTALISIRFPINNFIMSNIYAGDGSKTLK